MISISVIVPVYNTAALLPRCIDSILNQTLQEIEVILVDDASTDNSLTVIRNYFEKNPLKIRVIHSEINMRQGGARNLGMEIAQGEYISFVDSDDYIENDMLELMYNEAIRTDSDICRCQCRKIDSQGNTKLYTPSFVLPAGIVTEQSRRTMIANNVTLIPCHIYKRQLFTDNKISFPQNIRYEDMVIDPLLLPYIKCIAAVDRPLYNYCIQTESTTTSINSFKYQDKLNVCMLIVDEYKQRGYYEQYHNEINFLYFRKGYIHTTINYVLNAVSPQLDTVVAIRQQMLLIDSNYRHNPYYLSRFAFRIIDYFISARSVLLLKFMKWAFKLCARQINI